MLTFLIQNTLFPPKLRKRLKLLQKRQQNLELENMNIELELRAIKKYKIQNNILFRDLNTTLKNKCSYLRFKSDLKSIQTYANNKVRI